MTACCVMHDTDLKFFVCLFLFFDIHLDFITVPMEEPHLSILCPYFLKYLTKPSHNFFYNIQFTRFSSIANENN